MSRTTSLFHPVNFVAKLTVAGAALCACGGTVAADGIVHDAALDDAEGHTGGSDGAHVDAGDCAALSTCCDSLAEQGSVFGCLIASGTSPTLCATSLAALQGVGYCGRTDAATISLGGLGECCPMLPPAEVGACNQVATKGSEESCVLADMSVGAAGYCLSHSPDAGGLICTKLAACCPSLSGGAQTTCDTVAAEGYESICKAKLDYEQQYGKCGG
jgi:hypothetical protein